MPRISKSARISLWQDRLERFGQSDQTIAEFCLSENISQASFYQWKRRLLPDLVSATQRRKRSVTASRQRFTQLSVAGSDVNHTRIRLADHVVIELGDDQTAAQMVLEQVLNRCLPGQTISHGQSEAASC